MGLTCADVMVPADRQHKLLPEDSAYTAFKKIRASRATVLPVVKADGTYVGVFTSPTLIKLLLPRAVTIQLGGDHTQRPIEHLGFFNLSRGHFDDRIPQLESEKIIDHLSLPENIPVIAPDTPLMEGMLMIYKHKRHLILVEPGSGRYVGLVSPNSLLDHVLPAEDKAD